MAKVRGQEPPGHGHCADQSQRQVKIDHSIDLKLKLFVRNEKVDREALNAAYDHPRSYYYAESVAEPAVLLRRNQI